MRKLIFIIITLLITTEMFADFSRDNEKEIVTDNKTALMWQDDSTTKTKQMNFADAKNSCEALKLGGYDDWRVPSIEELQTIIDYSQNPALQKEFVNSSSIYLSSTATIKNNNEVIIWFINNKGNIDNDTLRNGYVRCVRGGSFGNFNSFAEYQRSGFTRDDKTKIVTDTKTNLQWQDNEAVKLTNKKWIDAVRYCKELKLGGFDNWRLPRIEELQTITDSNRNNPVLNNAFVNYFDSDYWSSTACASTIDEMWAVSTMHGSTTSYYNKPPNKRHTRCIRDSQTGTSPLSYDDNVTKEIQHYSYPAARDFIMAQMPKLEDAPDVKWQYVKKLDKNKSLYQVYQKGKDNISVVLVGNIQKMDIESISIIDPVMDTDKVTILRRLGIDTNETANTLVLVCNHKRLQLIFDESSSSLIRIEITKEQK